MKFELKDTIEMMQSSDYKERFRAEYAQLAIRAQKLKDMLYKYRTGKLTFKPSCQYEYLFEQFVYMKNYLDVLDERAEIEGIDITELHTDL